MDFKPAVLYIDFTDPNEVFFITLLCCLCVQELRKESKEETKEVKEVKELKEVKEDAQRRSSGNVASLVQRISTYGIPAGGLGFQPRTSKKSESVVHMKDTVKRIKK